MRHGLSEMNVAGLIAGITETPLTREGREQAKKAGRAAKGLGIDLIVSSPMSRAHETARIVASEIGFPEENILTSPLLFERNYGVLEGTPYVAGKNMDEFEGYEKDTSLIARAQQALDWINGLEANHILVVSHGAFGRALRSILKTDFPMSHPERINNAEILAWVEEEN